MNSETYSTAKLTAGQRDFLQGLRGDESMRRWGFEQLIARKDALKFLKPMVDLGFFSPAENPSPVPADKPGSYRIPRWDVMIYLEKAAEDAGAQNDSLAAKEILAILRSVTNYRNSDNTVTDNYGTWHSFAKIISALPLDSYSAGDLRMLQIWLESHFERGMMVGVVLGKDLLPKLLEGKEAAKDKALVVIEEATRLKWLPSPTSFSPDKTEPVTAVDPYWLRELFKKHSKALGEKCAPEVQKVLMERVGELFSRTGEDDHSWSIRPAIERHATQNFDFRQAHAALIDALRDTLLAFSDTSPNDAKVVIRDLLKSEHDICKRIGIHVIDERYGVLSDVFRPEMSALFKVPLIHETYRLLQRNFGSMPREEQVNVIQAIKAINLGSDKAEDTKRFQGRLAHAIHAKGNEDADCLHEELTKVANWDREDAHPDFLSYMTSWSGPGPSPYSIEQLRLLSDDQLIETLNNYEEPKGWHGPRVPSAKALCDAVTQLAKENSERFLELIPRLPQFKPAYQYAILESFRGLSHSGTPTEQGAKLPWQRFWMVFLGYLRVVMLEEILLPKADDPDPETFTPTRRWLVPLIADLIRNGTHDDHRAIPIVETSTVVSVIRYVLGIEKSTAEGKDKDAMTEAINTAKGHWIEALVDFSLYACRHAEHERKSHTAEWQMVQPLFDREIALCKSGNYEFSTLCATYVANLYFMSPEWLSDKIDDIFPQDQQYSRNFDCAVQGFAYMPQPMKETYRLMRSRGIFHTAMARSTKGRHAREKLLQHISVAYLWDDESLDGKDSLVRTILVNFDPSDIHEIVRFFWGLQGDQLIGQQVDKIFGFWRACMAEVDERKDGHTKVLSDLGLLAAFLKNILPEQKQWLLRIAPYIGVNHNTDFFVEYLEQLADVNPKEVGEITVEVVKADRPYYDFEDRYQSIIRKLLATEHYRLGLEICNQPGLMDLAPIAAMYAEFRRRNGQ